VKVRRLRPIRHVSAAASLSMGHDGHSSGIKTVLNTTDRRQHYTTFSLHYSSFWGRKSPNFLLSSVHKFRCSRRWPDITPPPGHNPWVRVPRSVARPDKTHAQKWQNHTSPTWKLNFRIGGRKPPNITPWVQNQRVMSGGLRPPILKFSFQKPLSWNRKRHRTLCSIILYRELCSGGFVRPFHWQGVLTQGVMTGGFMSANRSRLPRHQWAVSLFKLCRQHCSFFCWKKIHL